jgi:hypothetical protein
MIFIGITLFVSGMIVASALSAIRGSERIRRRRRSDRPYAL